MRNKHRLTKRGRAVTYGTAALLAIAGLTATAVTTLAAPDAAAEPSTSLTGATARVTLVTGDTVGVTGGTRVVGVDRGEGRSKIPVSVQSLGGHTYVIPDDAAPLLASGRLDRRLFDVTQLVADGYDDAHRKTLPLIVSYKGSAADSAKAALHSAVAEVERQLPALRGQAVTADKPDTEKVWNALTRPAGNAVTTERGVDHVWLDGKVTALPQQDGNLDPTQGTAQIHAPEAWKAGYDGKGVKVAVLDTGIDATHADVKGAIVATKDFTGSGTTDDGQGHGTHVASTILGSGARSSGKYKGVAPGAKLLFGRVMDDNGAAQDSWIIAGMQWAAGQGAKVVNMSLGMKDSTGVDPLEKAVDDLSASSGALFVIASGNEGPTAGTVDSPGAAAAALTVAAADSNDKLADFSSRGPTADDDLKPDITAPGVDIIGAKAAHGSEGDTAAAGYVSMSGTSMATPHVAGAAAILAQEHPDWTGQRIKAALMGSTVPLKDSSTPYEQGTGRVDVLRAVHQTVFADDPSLSFGLQKWPHTDDQPVTKQLTYRNTGDKPVTLDLSASTADPDGKAAPSGMITLSPAKVTVPAGGTAQTAVTADTRVNATDGVYGGTITATATTGESVRTTLGVTREPESYNLTLKAVGRDGRAATPHHLNIIGLDSGKWWMYADDGTGQDATSTTKIRVPKGRYLISAQLTRGTDTSSSEMTQLVSPGLEVNKDTTMSLDARTGKPVKITAPDPRAKVAGGTVIFGARGAKSDYDYASSEDLTGSYSRLYLAQAGPSASAKNFIAQIGGTWQHGSTGPLYDLVTTRKGSFFTGLTHTFTTRGLAKVVTPFGSNAKGSTVRPTANWNVPGWSMVSDLLGSYFGNSRAVPSTSVVHYVTTEGGLRWNLGGSVDSAEYPAMSILAPLRPRRFEPGRTYRETYNTGVFSPIITTSTALSDPGASRSGDFYAVCVPLMSDAAGHSNTSLATTHLRLTSGGKTITDFRHDPCGEVSGGLLSEKATYRLSLDASYPAGDVTIGNRVTTVWTFTSAHVPSTSIKRLPLSVIRFTPKLSLTGTTKAGARLTLPIGIQGPAAAKGAVKSLTVQVSYDGGRTWKRTTVHTGQAGKRSVTLAHPAKPGKVSLRATLVDTDGNSVTETLSNAYRTVR
ncbi:S8 family serine peptidase [Streptomyces sp. GQFP]|uniref:S8 family serine peptidase n=1 Tax=Streptomyces sp. GQFP TaxID=2907545 RepID=UPI001F19A4A9|nr:S8 family serine peptidase [Streptomyces sp. GQFP]UIX29239.1 S8 family serine peptidase [Streptomyces sp. GQFP]